MTGDRNSEKEAEVHMRALHRLSLPYHTPANVPETGHKQPPLTHTGDGLKAAQSTMNTYIFKKLAEMQPR